MKKTSSKKLMLARDTLRHLNALDLRRAGGGQTLLTCSDLCSSPDLCTDTNVPRWCNLDTQFVHGCASG